MSLPLGCCPVGKEVNTILRGRVEKHFTPLTYKGTTTNIRFNGKELCDVFTEQNDCLQWRNQKLNSSRDTHYNKPSVQSDCPMMNQ